MEIQEHISLAEYTTFGIGGPARYFAEARSEGDVAEAVQWAGERGVRLFVLGGGSNLLVPDQGFDGLALHMDVRGIEQHAGSFEAGAGECWDSFVSRTVDAGYAGVECLAGIPGSVGGTPVQNVGAYGQEVAETTASVRAFDRTNGEFIELSKAECGFRYRESIFNTTQRGRYIVTRVRFALQPGGSPQIRYAELQRRFADHPSSPTLAEVADAVRDIRRAKGMLIVKGEADSRSAGSFFKNPVVPAASLGQIAARARVSEGDVPHWPAGDRLVKLPAAWLLERAGFVKGYGTGRVRISSRHTLALTNRGGATFAEVIALQQEIVERVRQIFGVSLEREPVSPA